MAKAGIYEPASTFSEMMQFIAEGCLQVHCLWCLGSLPTGGTLIEVLLCCSSSCRSNAIV